MFALISYFAVFSYASDYYVINSQETEGNKVSYKGRDYTVITFATKKTFASLDTILFLEDTKIPSGITFPSDGVYFVGDNNENVDISSLTNSLSVIPYGMLTVKGTNSQTLAIDKSITDGEITIDGCTINSLKIGRRTKLTTSSNTILPKYVESPSSGIIEITYDIIGCGHLIINSPISSGSIKIHAIAYNSEYSKYVNDAGNDFTLVSGTSLPSNLISVELSTTTTLQYGMKMNVEVESIDSTYKLKFTRHVDVQEVPKVCFNANGCSTGFTYVSDMSLAYGIETISAETAAKNIVLSASQLKGETLTIYLATIDKTKTSSIDIFPDALNKLESGIKIKILSGYNVNIEQEVQKALGSTNGHISSLELSNVKATYYGNGNIPITTDLTSLTISSNALSPLENKKVTVKYGKFSQYFDPLPYLIFPYDENKKITIPSVDFIYMGEMTSESDLTNIPLIAYSSSTELGLDTIKPDFENKILLDKIEIANTEFIFDVALEMKETFDKNVNYYGMGINLTEKEPVGDTPKVCFKINGATGNCPPEYDKVITTLSGIKNCSDLYLVYTDATDSITIPTSLMNMNDLKITGNNANPQHALTIILKFEVSNVIQKATLSTGSFILKSGAYDTIHHFCLENCDVTIPEGSGIYYKIEIDKLSKIQYTRTSINQITTIIHTDGDSIGYAKYSLGGLSSNSYVSILFEEMKSIKIANQVFFEIEGSTEIFEKFTYMFDTTITIDQIYSVAKKINGQSVSFIFEATGSQSLAFCYKPTDEFMCESGYIPVNTLEGIPKIEKLYVYQEASNKIYITGLSFNQIKDGVDIYTSTEFTYDTSKTILIRTKIDSSEDDVAFYKFHGHVYFQFDDSYPSRAQKIILDDGYFIYNKNVKCDVEVHEGSYFKMEYSNKPEHIDLHYGGSKATGIIYSSVNDDNNVLLPKLIFNGIKPSGEALQYPMFVDITTLRPPSNRIGASLHFENIIDNDGTIVLLNHHKTGENEYRYYLENRNVDDPLKILYGTANQNPELISFVNYSGLTNIVYMELTADMKDDFDIQYFQNITIQAKGSSYSITITGIDEDKEIYVSLSRIYLTFEAQVKTSHFSGEGYTTINSLPSTKLYIQEGGTFTFDTEVPDNLIEISSNSDQSLELKFNQSMPIIIISQRNYDCTITLLNSNDISLFDGKIKASVNDNVHFPYLVKNPYVNGQNQAELRINLQLIEKIISPKLCLGTVEQCNAIGLTASKGYTITELSDEYRYPSGYYNIEEIVYIQASYPNFFYDSFVPKESNKVVNITGHSQNRVSFNINLFSNEPENIYHSSFNLVENQISVNSRNCLIKYDSVVFNSCYGSLNGVTADNIIINRYSTVSLLGIPKSIQESVKIEMNYYNSESILFSFAKDDTDFYVPNITVNLYSAAFQPYSYTFGILDTYHTDIGDNLRKYLNNRFTIINKNSNCNFEISEKNQEGGSSNIYGYAISPKTEGDCREIPITFSPSSNSQSIIEPTTSIPDDKFDVDIVETDKDKIVIDDGKVEGIEIPDSGNVIILNSNNNFIIFSNKNNNKVNIYVAPAMSETVITIEPEENYENKQYGIVANNLNPTVDATLPKEGDKTYIPIRILADSYDSSLTLRINGSDDSTDTLSIKDIILQASDLVINIPQNIKTVKTDEILSYQSSGISLASNSASGKNLLTDSDTIIVSANMVLKALSNTELTNIIITDSITFNQSSHIRLSGTKSSLNNSNIIMLVNPQQLDGSFISFNDFKSNIGVPKSISIESTISSHSEKLSSDLLLIQGTDSQFECEKWASVVSTSLFDNHECRKVTDTEIGLFMTNNNPPKNNKLPLIIGVVVAVVVVIVIIIVVVVCVRRKNRSKSHSSSTSFNSSDDSVNL
ncbi:hypothetical protein TRFO_41014 [Tritrichomonas foetus]|uniref:Uncharacterized protein n=1 Tax=Tritrichomonas foetus TaxID=1144522 RepID=A0A1J4L624_9EUKA|nr:hypothetical protein TRFO_41014 [Tritrichomonas foetus]|eukprot:OHT17397.1 hypothetical protein TRFO_41014 [Tritrichomonas foetus]